MRTLRLSLVGTVILMLLGGLGGVALAQDDPMAPAKVTGTWAGEGGEFEFTPMDGYSLGRAWAPEGSTTVSASDPRVSGTATTEWWNACYLVGPDDPPYYPSGCIYWGTQRLDGPDGSWEGSYRGVDDESLGQAFHLLLMEGTGAYEGLSFVAHVQDPFTGEPVTMTGLIYEGPLPPWEPPLAE
jgi:hypothetical protein